MLLPTAVSRHATHPTACRTCRRRRRKCDKTLPSCQSCCDRSITCEGYVTRWPGIAARGRLCGKVIPVIVNEETSSKHVAKKDISSSTALTRSPSASSRKQRQQGDQVVNGSAESPALVIERIVPGSSDGLDSFIDYCESRFSPWHECLYYPSPHTHLRGGR